MKELKIIAIATIITICIMVSCAFAMPAQAETMNPNYGEFYPRLAIVVEREEGARIKGDYDTITCRDKEGNLRQFFCDRTDDWDTGDICNLMMWNNSQDVTKHEIIEVYWEGYTSDLNDLLSLFGWAY